MKLNLLLTLLVLIATFCYIETAKIPKTKSKTSWKKNYLNSTKAAKTGTTTDRKLSIVGGMSANPGQFPYVVYIDFTGGCDEWFCTGVLIYYNYVITTASCIDGAEEVTVLLGEYDLSASTPVERSKSRVRIFGRQWTFHENFDYDFQYDIGIIQLPLHAVANLNITTIGMSLVNVNNNYVGKTGTIAGWGSLNPSSYPDHLLYTTLNVISTATCQLDWNFVTSDSFCAAPPTSSIHQGACYGDIGGPFVYLGLLLGIANSFDYECEYDATVFTPIAPYYSWILGKTNEAAIGNFWTVPIIPK